MIFFRSAFLHVFIVCLGISMVIQPTSSSWINKVQNNFSEHKAGFVYFSDSHDRQYKSAWEVVNPKSLDFNEKVRSVADFLAKTYSKIELDFAQKYPEAVQHDFMLKSCAPYFEDGLENVNWKAVEHHIATTLLQFLTHTDFVQKTGEHDFHLFVTVIDKKTGTLCGFVQFLITPDMAFGTVKIGYFGSESHANSCDLSQIMMGIVFKLIPEIERLQIHVRISNRAYYESLGFKLVSQPTPYWVVLEYATKDNNMLQKIVDAFV